MKSSGKTAVIPSVFAALTLLVAWPGALPAQNASESEDARDLAALGLPPIYFELIKAHSTAKAHTIMLKLIPERFPAQAARAKVVKQKWDAAFKEAEAGVEIRLKAPKKSMWDAVQKKLTEAESLLRKEVAEFTEETASTWLDESEQRIKGTMDFDGRAALLASHPAFAKSPSLEFSKGFTAAFSSKDHKKADGFDIVLKHPLSWQASEMDLSSAIQKWTSDAGFGSDSIILQINKLPNPLQGAELEAMFTQASAAKLVGERAKVTSFASGKIRDQRMGFASFAMQTGTGKDVRDVRSIIYYFITGDRLVNIQMHCYSPAGSGISEKRRALLEPLLKFVVNSVELPK